MEKGRGCIWREEGESPSGEASSLFLADTPRAWPRLPARGGDSLQMHPVVIPGHGADGAQCPKGSHRDLGDHGESLRGELPATPDQPPFGLGGTDQDREERVLNL